MTLTTHTVVGAAAAGLFPQAPVAAFAAGFVSHFVLDAIPHWAEGDLLRSTVRDPLTRRAIDMPFNRAFARDLLIIGTDALLGLVSALSVFYVLFFHFPLIALLAGAAGGVFPDFLQYVYFKTRFRFMTPLQDFHSSIQTELKNPLTLGIELALLTALIAALRILL